MMILGVCFLFRFIGSRWFYFNWKKENPVGWFVCLFVFPRGVLKNEGLFYSVEC